MGGIGEMLKSTREAKDITLQQAEEDTKIRKRYLQALEEDDYDVIPGRVYAKGFLRNYANYLGLNQEEVMLGFKLMGASSKEEYKKVDIEESINKKKRSADRAERKNYLVTVIIAVFAVVVLVFYNFGLKNSADDNGNQTADRSKTEQRDQQKPTEKPAENPSVNEPQQPGGQNGNTSGGTPGQGTAEPSVTGVNLTLNIKDQICWVKVTVDGVIKFTGNLNPGESKTYSGTGKITARVGNAGAVEAIFNGQNLGRLGKMGEPDTKEFVSATTPGSASNPSAVQDSSRG